MDRPAYRMGIDLGGTKIEAAVFDRDHTPLFRERIKTPRHDYEATIEAIRTLCENAETALCASVTVGVGMPGALSPHTGLIKNANSTWLIDKPFDRDLEACLGRPVRFANDANCFALSEAVDGAGHGAHTVFGVILGTGCGGGIVVGQKLLVGANAIAGEWGHTPLPAPSTDESPGPECYCGRLGCLETWLAGPAIERFYKERSGQTKTASEIAEAADKNDGPATACFRDWLSRLGRGLSTVINILDPDIIVLGGGLSNIDRIYAEIDGYVHPHVFSDRCTTPIVKHHHGDSSGVRGAAWLWGPDEGAAS